MSAPIFKNLHLFSWFSRLFILWSDWYVLHAQQGNCKTKKHWTSSKEIWNYFLPLGLEEKKFLENSHGQMEQNGITQIGHQQNLTMMMGYICHQIICGMIIQNLYIIITFVNILCNLCLFQSSLMIISHCHPKYI